MTNKTLPSRQGTFRGLPSGIWALGMVSLFMDASSEMIHSLLPVYMTTVLGAGLLSVGAVEGIAEATAAIMKLFSGVISDYFKRRKLLAVIGYGLSALCKPLFPLATSMIWVFAARFADRIGKGIREAPRDALIAAITPQEQRGAAYGLRQALDSAGAFVGPVLAVVLMTLLSNNIRHVFWAAVIPALISVVLLVVGVRESGASASGKTISGTGIISFQLVKMPRRFRLVVLFGVLFTLARSSDAFLVLRALDSGLTVRYVPLVMVAMNVVYSATAYPAGLLSDRYGSTGQLKAGIWMLISADILLAVARGPFVVFAGVVFWGLHMGLTQGVLTKMAANSVPEEQLGTAFGIFNLCTSIALLVSSLFAGALWQVAGAPATFISGAFFAGFSAIGLYLLPELREE
jgi:MFS family permease